MAPRRKFLASAARIVDRYSSGAVACNKSSSRTLHRAYAVSLLFLASKASLREVRKLPKRPHELRSWNRRQQLREGQAPVRPVR